MANTGGSAGMLQQNRPASSPITACYHCGLPALASCRADINGEAQAFCCMGCQAVALTIHGAGLDQFYQFRQVDSPQPDEAARSDNSAFDSPEFLAEHALVIEGEPALTEIHLSIDDIRCAACVWLIEQHLGALVGVEQCHVLLGSKRARIRWNNTQITLSAILNAVADIGYKAAVVNASNSVNRASKELLRLGVAGFGMMQVGMYSVALYAGAWQGISQDMRLLLRLGSGAVATLVLLVSALPFFINAFNALKHKHVVMDVPIAVAIALAYSASVWATLSNSGEVYFDSVTMFSFFILLSRFIEASVNRRFSEQQQTRLVPHTIKRVNANQSYDDAPLLACSELKIGDKVWLAAGQTLPVDAQLLSTQAEFDESVVSGESLPVQRKAHEMIFAGSINGDALIQLAVTAVGQKTRLNTLQRLQFEAQSQRPKWESLASAIAAKFVVVILLLAAVTYIAWLQIDASKALWVALSVLVVSCPCALSLATPTVYTAALSVLRQAGILVRDGRYLERLAKVSDVVFDKTGTLTEGRLGLLDVGAYDDAKPKDILAIAASLEQGAHHPVASALRKEALQQRVLVPMCESPQFITGGGVMAELAGERYILGSERLLREHTSLNLAQLSAIPEAISVSLAKKTDHGWQLCAHFSFSDTLRADASATVQQLRDNGLSLAIMSGDSSLAVARVATSLAVTDVSSGLSAAQKLTAIKVKQQQGKVVLSVGDGLNDLPFLGGADVSVAVANASDLSLQNANINLLRDDLLLLPRLLRTAKLAMRRLRQNLAWALVYNAVMIPLAMAGLIAPWLAALGMSISSLVVVINARRMAVKGY